MSKIGVIDIGSNSVRMVIFDAMARAPHYLFNEKVMCRLGAGFSETGKLSSEGVKSAKDTLERFVYLANAMRVSNLEIVGTAALREAEDGQNFVAWVKKKLNEDVRVLTGEEEAKLSAQGVLLGWPDANGLVCDIGGSSVELIEVRDGQIGDGVSMALGPLRLSGLSEEELHKTIAHRLRKARKEFSQDYDRIYLVGGSWRALAKIDMHRKKYPFPILHEYEMTPKDIKKSLKLVDTLTTADLSELTGVSFNRMELVPMAGLVLQGIIKAFEPKILAVSGYGLREGVLFENMPSWMRSSDPLLAASEELESELARFPGFGMKLYNWLAPIRTKYNKATDRLAQAACLLHDTNWRYHPDFRAQMSFEIIAQANICGLTHEERLFIALALASRYENKPEHAYTHPAINLLEEGRRGAAVELGRAMRLGSMVSASIGELLDHTRLENEEDGLVLRINKDMRAIYGDSVEKRLMSLEKYSTNDVRVEVS